MKRASGNSARRFRFGPATTLAIGAALAIGYTKWPDYAREAEVQRDLKATRAAIARDAIARRGISKKSATRTLETIWAARHTLKLSQAQIQSFSALRAQEMRETAQLQRETKIATADFSRWMNEHKSGATISEIQSRALPYSAKSDELATRRREFWNRGIALLTPAQRAQGAFETP